MSQFPSPSDTPETTAGQSSPTSTAAPTASETPEVQTSTPQPSYVKLAMRNMVRKRGKSLFHFTLTTVGLLTVLIGLAYLTR